MERKEHPDKEVVMPSHQRRRLELDLRKERYANPTAHPKVNPYAAKWHRPVNYASDVIVFSPDKKEVLIVCRGSKSPWGAELWCVPGGHQITTAPIGENHEGAAIQYAETFGEKFVKQHRADAEKIWSEDWREETIERPVGTAVRELSEETGLDLTGTNLTMHYLGARCLFDRRGTEGLYVANAKLIAYGHSNFFVVQLDQATYETHKKSLFNKKFLQQIRKRRKKERNKEIQDVRWVKMEDLKNYEIAWDHEEMIQRGVDLLTQKESPKKKRIAKAHRKFKSLEFVLKPNLETHSNRPSRDRRAAY
ncbi:MAG: NUDIX hydrolase [Verrucomicrobiota bacterium]